MTSALTSRAFPLRRFFKEIFILIETKYTISNRHSSQVTQSQTIWLSQTEKTESLCLTSSNKKEQVNKIGDAFPKFYYASPDTSTDILEDFYRVFFIVSNFVKEQM